MIYILGICHLNDKRPFNFICRIRTWLTVNRTSMPITAICFLIFSITVSAWMLRFWICTCTRPLLLPCITCLRASRPSTPVRPHSIHSYQVNFDMKQIWAIFYLNDKWIFDLLSNQKFTYPEQGISAYCNHLLPNYFHRNFFQDV